MQRKFMSKRFFTQISGDSPNLAQEDSNNKDTSNNQIEQQVDRSEQLWSSLTSTPSDRLVGQEKKRSPRSRPWWELRAKATAVAIAMLPALAIGTATYYCGTQVITEQATQARRDGRAGLGETELSQQRQLDLLATLTIGTGATALLAGAIAALWSDRVIRSAKIATTAAQTSTEARIERTKLFTDAVHRIRATLTQENVLKSAVEETRKAIAAERVMIYSLDEKSRGTVIAESVFPNWPKALPRALGSSVKDHHFEEVYLENYQNGRIQVVDDIYQANLTPCHLEILETYAVRANLVAPLLSENKLIGLLLAHQCSGPRTWQQSEVDLFTQIATQVGFALDDARLVAESGSLKEQLDSETKWNDLFADATQRIHAALNQEDILKVAVEQARRFLACDRALVYSLNGKSLGIIIAESVASGFAKGLGQSFEDPCFTARYIEKYQNGRVLAVENIYKAGMSACHIESLEKLAVKANLTAPLLHEGKLFGLLIAHQCSEPRNWRSVEVEWFTQVAAQVGFALDNFQLAQSRIEQAIQEMEAEADSWQQEKAALRQQMTSLLKQSETAFEAFSAALSRQVETATSAIAQMQAIADSARSMVASAQKAELHLQQVTQVVQTGHETVNKTVDSIAAVQETVIDLNVKLQRSDDMAHQLTELVSLINQVVAQANRQAINATIESGKNGDAFQQSVVYITESVRSLTQQLTQATTEMEPLVAEFETQTEDMSAILERHSVEVTTEMELLTKETRQKLNQLATTSAKIGNLVNSIAATATDQAQTFTTASQAVLDVANLAAQTSAKSAVVVESFTKLEAFIQEL
jgi:twitching motility protein PilJ